MVFGEMPDILGGAKAKPRLLGGLIRHSNMGMPNIMLTDCCTQTLYRTEKEAAPPDPEGAVQVKAVLDNVAVATVHCN